MHADHALHLARAGICLAVALAVPTAGAQTQAPELAQKEKGFALEAGGAFIPLYSGGVLDLNLLLGYKVRRLVVGLGCDLNVPLYSTNPSLDAPFVIYPEAQIAAVRSANERFELVLGAGVGAGPYTRVTRVADAMFGSLMGEDETETTARLTWHVVSGLRIWARPALGLNLLAGVEGNHFFADGYVFKISGLSPLLRVGLMGVFSRD